MTSRWGADEERIGGWLRWSDAKARGGAGGSFGNVRRALTVAYRSGPCDFKWQNSDVKQQLRNGLLADRSQCFDKSDYGLQVSQFWYTFRATTPSWLFLLSTASPPALFS